MHALDQLHKIFNQNLIRAKESYTIKPETKTPVRTARSSSLNEALKRIQQNLKDK